MQLDEGELGAADLGGERHQTLVCTLGTGVQDVVRAQRLESIGLMAVQEHAFTLTLWFGRLRDTQDVAPLSTHATTLLHLT